MRTQKTSYGKILPTFVTAFQMERLRYQFSEVFSFLLHNIRNELPSDFEAGRIATTDPRTVGGGENKPKHRSIIWIRRGGWMAN